VFDDQVASISSEGPKEAVATSPVPVDQDQDSFGEEIATHVNFTGFLFKTNFIHN
jgi:hypothetical protein